jgi:hypothetical protein
MRVDAHEEVLRPYQTRRALIKRFDERVGYAMWCSESSDQLYNVRPGTWITFTTFLDAEFTW